MLPSLGFSNAPSKLRSVVLPLPLRPMIEAKQPSGSLKLTLLTATTAPLAEENCLVRLVTFNMISSLFRSHYFCRSNFSDKASSQGTTKYGNYNRGSKTIEQ